MLFMYRIYKYVVRYITDTQLPGISRNKTSVATHDTKPMYHNA